MGTREKTDTCDWCGAGTNRLQISGGTGLCPSCCPDVTEENVPDHCPSSWFSMTGEEKEDWHQGLDMEEIMEKHNWGVHP